MEEPTKSHNLSQEIEFSEDDESDENSRDLDDCLFTSSDDSMDLSTQIHIQSVARSQMIQQSQAFTPPKFSDDYVESAKKFIDLQSSLEDLNVTLSGSPDDAVDASSRQKVSADDNEEFIVINFDVNPALFGPPVEFPADHEKIQQVFLTKGFVTAKKFQQIEKKVADEEFDDDFDCEGTMNQMEEIEEIAEIDNSISVLSNILSSSKNEENCKGIEVSQIFDDIEDEFEEPVIKDTDALETSVLGCTQYDESMVESDSELNSTFIRATDDLEHSVADYEEFKTQKVEFQMPQICMGFRTAKSNKPIASTSAMLNIQKKFEAEDEQFQSKLRAQLNLNDHHEIIPKESQFNFGETEQLEQEILNELETQYDNRPKQSSAATQYRQVQMQLNDLNDIDLSEDDEPTVSRLAEFPIDFGGFTTAKGNKVATVKNIEKFKENFHKFNDEVLADLGCKIGEIPKFAGFQLASGKKCEVQDKNLLKNQHEKFKEFDQDESLAGIEIEDDDIFGIGDAGPMKTTEVPAFAGFTFAGKPATTGDAAQKQIELFKELDQQYEADINEEEFSFKTPVAAKEFFHSRSRLSSSDTPGTSKSSKGKVKSKKSLLASIEEFANEDEIVTPNLPLPTKVNKHKSADNVDAPPPLKRARLKFDSPQPSTSSPFLMRRFAKGLAGHSTSTPVVARQIAKIHDKSSRLQIDSLLNDSSVTIENFAMSPTVKRNVNVKKKLDEKFDDDDEDDDDMINFSAIEKIEKVVSRVPREICELRRKSLLTQQNEIEEKADYEKRAMTGSVFMKKSGRNRMKLVDYVKSSPQNLHRHDISYSDAIDYKFSMENYPEFELTLNCASEIAIADNAKLILNNMNQVGITEISSAFLASPGVDPSLISRAWIDNAYKFLITKFTWLENSFDAFDKFELLTPENVLLQLKYRYDREIDLSHRSAIKKIVEMDDVVSRRMILRIEEIHESQTMSAELTLSDGWYAIRAKIDSCIDSAIECGKIQVGKKLVISCADLIGAENGFDPLNMPSNVYLKIQGNSTRLVRWHEKMGFCANPYPIDVRVDAVKETGGIIGRMNIAVVHVYDVVYADAESHKDFISERVYNRLQQEQNIKNSSLSEIIAQQMENEQLKSSKDRVKCEKLKEKSLKNCSASQIYDLMMATGNDDVTELTQKTREKVQDVSCQRQIELYDEVARTLGEKTKKITRILRFRVVDAFKPDKTALVSFWSPSDDIISEVQVGRQFEMMKSFPSSHRNEMQIKANPSTSLRPITKISMQDFSKYARNLTEFSTITAEFDPQHQEFDIICIIVKIEDPVDSMQKILVSDENFNFLYINFWTSLNNYAMSSVIEEGKIFYMKNLQWRKNHPQNLKYLQVFMQTEVSSAVENLKNLAVEMKLSEFRDSIGNPSEFIEKCRQVLNEEIDITVIRKDKENIHNNSTKSPSKLNISKSTSLPFDFKTPATASNRRLGMRESRSAAKPALRSNMKRTRSDYASLSLAKKKKSI